METMSKSRNNQQDSGSTSAKTSSLRKEKKNWFDFGIIRFAREFINVVQNNFLNFKIISVLKKRNVRKILEENLITDDIYCFFFLIYTSRFTLFEN